DPFVMQTANMESGNPSNHTDEGGVAEVEEILKHKTFTRILEFPLLSVSFTWKKD
ncbi:hypothetical protein V6N11_034228, partial [Hibiscus sabdariffa]